MTRPGRPPRSQQRPLTPEDEALWHSVARSLEPVRKKPRVHRSAEPSGPMPEQSEARLPPRLTEKLKAAAQPTKPPAGPRQPSPEIRIERKPPPLAEFDRRQVRRIASGRIDVEARLDLHGMRSGEAHAALRNFVLRCYARGQRNLLVITGKGSRSDLSDRPFDWRDHTDRGVLKRSVPLWLADPDLRSVVVSFTQAHARHGGEGALYIQLRSRRRADERG